MYVKKFFIGSLLAMGLLLVAFQTLGGLAYSVTGPLEVGVGDTFELTTIMTNTSVVTQYNLIFRTFLPSEIGFVESDRDECYTESETVLICPFYVLGVSDGFPPGEAFSYSLVFSALLATEATTIAVVPNIGTGSFFPQLEHSLRITETEVIPETTLWLPMIFKE